MANITITNLDIGSIIVKDPVFQDDTYTAAGATDVAAGTILARDSVSGKLVDFVKGGSTNENGIPKVIVTETIEPTGAGDFPCRPLIEGVVKKEKLIIVADGDATNIDAAVKDQLRDYKISAIESDEQLILDNQ